MGCIPLPDSAARIATVNNVPVLAETYDCYDPAVKKETGSICHVGSLTYTRGITHLVKAAAQADCTLYLGGAFSPAAYQDEVLSLPEAAHTRYMGVLNRAQVMQLLQKSQIGMATILNVGQYNQYDNLATKVYEYMALGLPVILSRSPYNEKVAAQYGFGICVDPANVDEIADAIRYLLDHPDEAVRWAKTAAVRSKRNSTGAWRKRNFYPCMRRFWQNERGSCGAFTVYECAAVCRLAFAVCSGRPETGYCL